MVRFLLESGAKTYHKNMNKQSVLNQIKSIVKEHPVDIVHTLKYQSVYDLIDEYIV